MSLLDHAAAETDMDKPDLDWANLDFGWHQTDCNLRYTWCDGQWDQGQLTSSTTLPLHMAATCLHYGQECFEGLKAFETIDGEVILFRPEQNASRLQRSCRKLYMPEISQQMFIDAVERVVDANRRFVPPHGTGASLYIRPLVIGTGPEVGVKPARQYMFVVFVTPVGPYFKTGFKPLDIIVEENIDRAAPQGVGDIKAGGNYAASLRAGIPAKQKGYADVLYLDAKHKKYIDESGPANFFAITRGDQFITPDSPSILASITNSSLMTLAREMGLNPQRRRIPIEEIRDFKEAGCCGTATVITPIGSVTWRDEKIVYCPQGIAGPVLTQLYARLTAIQTGDAPDSHNWLHAVPRR
ncbi:MAG: branched-chain amino acid aminotransferase [Phycisphaerae bacterium]